MSRKLLCYATLVLASALPLASQQKVQGEESGFQQQLQAGEEALAARQCHKAIDAFKKASKLHKNCAECYLGLAMVYLRMGDFGNGLENCDKAIRSAGDDPIRAKAHNLKGTALLALAQTNGKKLLEAEAEFRVASQLDKNVPLYHLGLAKALLRGSKDDDALAELRTCVALNPIAAVAEEAKLMIADPRRGRENFAANFDFTTLQGQVVSLKQLAGKIVVLDFWATWCPPCRASVPELQDLTRRYSADKLVLISISADKDDNAWRDFVAKKNMDWLQYRDTDGKVLESFGIHAFPTYLVIDRDGIIKDRILDFDPQQTVVHRLKSALEGIPQLQANAKN